jgi:glycosyltransferase involved in cell wall biosynthesis
MSKGKISILVPDVSSLGTTRAYIIAQGLQKLGYEAKIFGFIFGEQMYPETPFGIPIAYIGGSSLPQLIKTAFTFIKDIDGDILYVIKPQLGSFGLALLKTWWKKKPMILDIDDWEMASWGGDDWHYQGNLIFDVLSSDSEVKKPTHPFYLRWLEKQFEKVNGITVSSKFLEYRYGGTFLPSAIDINLFDPHKFDRLQIRKDTGLDNFILLVFTGTAKPNNGIEEILNALKQLNNPQLRLIIAGGNPQYKDYRQQLYEKWNPWVMLTTPYPFTSTQAIVSVADIIIYNVPNNIPNMAKCPFEILEGMAMAKPVIASQVGEIPLILGDTGYLVTENNSEKIAQQINLILSNPEEAQEKGLKARDRVKELYSTDMLTRTLQQVIDLATFN